VFTLLRYIDAGGGRGVSEMVKRDWSSRSQLLTLAETRRGYMVASVQH